MREEDIAMQDFSLSETPIAKASRKNKEPIVNGSLNVIVCKAIRNEASSGYAISLLIRKRFDIQLSPSTVNSLMYSLEKRGLVKACVKNRTRCYMLTQKGEETLRTVTNMQNRTKAPNSNIF